MLGWEMTPSQLAAGRLPFFTPVRNLYLTGHWTQPGGGITPVIVSAQRVAKIIVSGTHTDQEVAAQYRAFRGLTGSEVFEGVRT